MRISLVITILIFVLLVIISYVFDYDHLRIPIADYLFDITSRNNCGSYTYHLGFPNSHEQPTKHEDSVEKVTCFFDAFQKCIEASLIVHTTTWEGDNTSNYYKIVKGSPNTCEIHTKYTGSHLNMDYSETREICLNLDIAHEQYYPYTILYPKNCHKLQ